MKQVENKKVTLLGVETTYADQIKNCLRGSILKEGITYEGIRQRNRIEDVLLKEEKGFFNFEEADFSALQQFASVTSWLSYDKELQQFLDYIKDGGHKEVTNPE